LRDTVKDFGDPGGYGIRFNNPVVGDITQSVWRAVELYNQKDTTEEIRNKIMQLDFSWETSVQQYLGVYQSLIHTP